MKYVPAILGVTSLILFAAFVASLYNELVLKTWIGTIQYYMIVSSVGVYLEMALLSFALALAFAKPTRTKIMLAVIGIALVMVSVFNTVVYNSLALTGFSEWYGALLIRIFAPLAVGITLVAAIPVLEILLGGAFNKTMPQSDIQSMFSSIEKILADLKNRTEQDLQPEISAISDHVGKMRSKISDSRADVGVSVYIPDQTPGLILGSKGPVPPASFAAEASAPINTSEGSVSVVGDTKSAATENAVPKSSEKATEELQVAAMPNPPKESAKTVKPKAIAKKIATGAKKETKKLVTKVKKETEAVKAKAPKAKPVKAFPPKKVL